MSNEPIAVHPRFALATTIMVRESGTGAPILMQLKNISLSGCYLETPRQIPQDVRVRVVLQFAEIRADVWGVIRRHDAKGLGIQFTNGSTVEDWKRLESLIKELQTTAPARSASASS
jgi:PilZ domain-containing protein